MRKWVVAVFNKESKILDQEIFDSRRSAEREYEKIKKFFYRDGFARELILLEGNFDLGKEPTNYDDFEKKAYYVERKRYERK